MAQSHRIFLILLIAVLLCNISSAYELKVKAVSWEDVNISIPTMIRVFDENMTFQASGYSNGSYVMFSDMDSKTYQIYACSPDLPSDYYEGRLWLAGFDRDTMVDVSCLKQGKLRYSVDRINRTLYNVTLGVDEGFWSNFMVCESHQEGRYNVELLGGRPKEINNRTCYEFNKFLHGSKSNFIVRYSPTGIQGVASPFRLEIVDGLYFFKKIIYEDNGTDIGNKNVTIKVANWNVATIAFAFIIVLLFMIMLYVYRSNGKPKNPLVSTGVV